MAKHYVVLSLFALLLIVLFGCLNQEQYKCDNHKLGEVWDAGDACNSCTCTDSGINCTVKGCPTTLERCQSIEKQATQDSCFTDLFQKQYLLGGNLDVSLCERVAGADAKNRCYYLAAIWMNDSSSCSKISNSTYRQSCVIGLTNDLSLCERISDSQEKFDCYEQIAVSLKDPELCRKSGDYVDSCYQRIAQITKNETICQFILNSSRDFCLNQVSFWKKDRTICQNIQNQFMKDSCLKTKDRNIIVQKSVPRNAVDSRNPGLVCATLMVQPENENTLRWTCFIEESKISSDSTECTDGSGTFGCFACRFGCVGNS